MFRTPHEGARTRNGAQNHPSPLLQLDRNNTAVPIPAHGPPFDPFAPYPLSPSLSYWSDNSAQLRMHTWPTDTRSPSSGSEARHDHDGGNNFHPSASDTNFFAQPEAPPRSSHVYSSRNPFSPSYQENQPPPQMYQPPIPLHYHTPQPLSQPSYNQQTPMFQQVPFTPYPQQQMYAPYPSQPQFAPPAPPPQYVQHNAVAPPVPSRAPYVAPVRDPLADDRAHPRIRLEHIATASWPSSCMDLILEDGCWLEWSANVRRVLSLSGGLTHHLDGGLSSMVQEPNLEPFAARNWLTNDASVVSFIEMHLSSTEKTIMRPCSSSALELWTALTVRHANQGFYAQIKLLNQAMEVVFVEDTTTHAGTFASLQDLVERMWGMGPLNKDDLFLALLVRGLDGAPLIQRDVIRGLAEVTTTQPYTLANVSRLLTINVSVQPNTSQALVASSPITCSTAGCGLAGHTQPYCVKPGGGMAGKTIAEAREAQRLAKKKKGGYGGGGVKPKAYCADDEMAQLVTDDFDSIVTEEVRSSLTPGDYDELVACFGFEELTTSVDWKDNDFAYSASLTTVSLDSAPWHTDSGATVHITMDASDFSDLRPLKTPRAVRELGGVCVPALGIGTVSLRLSNNRVLSLQNVLWIPSSHVRLVSISRLIEDTKCGVHFSKGKVTLTRPGGKVLYVGAVSSSNSSLYQLSCMKMQSSTPPDLAFIASLTVTPTLKTWHLRLGHANNACVVHLATSKGATGMKIDLSSIPGQCSSCILGKQARTPVPKRRKRKCSKKFLDVVSLDLTGAQAVTSASGNLYTMSIIDESSCWPRIKPLRAKSDAFRELVAWELAMEAKHGRRPGKYRIDNGELKSIEFVNWCKSRGIAYEMTAAYTSAQNGQVERLHRTIISKGRTMRIDCGLPANRWDETCVTAGYLSARTPAAALKFRTPYEARFQTLPDLSHLREIRCKAYALIQGNNPKVYVRSLECILVGYAPNAKAYRLYHRPTHRIIESYHVRFVESRPLRSGPMDCQMTANWTGPDRKKTAKRKRPVGKKTGPSWQS